MCLPPVYSKTLRMSREDVTRLEISGHIVVSDVPAMLLLKNTISDSIAEAVDECIQARFGGVCLPTSIKDLQEVITNHSNFVAVETHNRLTIFFTVVNRSVARLPIFVVSNCIIHLLFDLTHERRFERVCCWSGVFPSMHLI